MRKNKIMDFFSALGRSLMMPIAALAACGIVLGLSSALMKPQVLEAAPFLSQAVAFIITTINKVSGVVFTLIPVLFAISISFGLAKEDKEVAAFAGFIGYYTFLVSSACMINTGFMDFSALKISAILGVETVDMGAIAGIITGIILGIGRAIGETMAVMLVCGNPIAGIPTSLFDQIRPLTTNIALEMGYASGVHQQLLFSTGVVLFVFIMIINIVLNKILKKGADDNE